LPCQTIEIFVPEFSMNVCVEVQITVLCNGGGFLVHPVREQILFVMNKNFTNLLKIYSNFFIARDASSAEKHNMSSFFCLS